MAINLFGFQIVRKPAEDAPQQLQPQISAPVSDDGAISVTAGGYFGTYLDLEASFKNENDLVTRYREMAMQPELEAAVDEIVNETIVHDITGKSVSIILDDLEQPQKIKDMIRDEFDNVLRMMDFSNYGSEVFRNWYIDGRLFYQVLIDEKQPKLGIQELVYIDPRKIKKVRTVIKKKDPRTKIEVVTGVEEFYIFNDKASQQGQQIVTSISDNAVKIAPDAIINVNSGLLDAKRQMVLSYLHKAIKPLNQLRMVEDAVVPAGQNLGELSDVKYFEQKLYKSLNVPISRLESQTGFSLGRTSEITRDELKFNKFIERVRSKFTVLFDELMKRQLALKGICSIDEWEVLKEKIHYDFLKDNNFTELKESELMTARLQLMNLVDPYVGTYFSRAWVKKHVLQFDEEGIERMDAELEEEKAAADAMGLGSLSVSAQNAAIAQNAAMASMPGEQPQQQASSLDQAFSSQVK